MAWSLDSRERRVQSFYTLLGGNVTSGPDLCLTFAKIEPEMADCLTV